MLVSFVLIKMYSVFFSLETKKQSVVSSQIDFNSLKVSPRVYLAESLPSNIDNLAENYRFKNAYDLFLGGDHYKWRLMRTFGIDEKLITGSADDFEKWKAFSEAVPYMIGNPMYHWTHLELKRYFDIDTTLSGGTAEEIWNTINEYLKKDLLPKTILYCLNPKDNYALGTMIGNFQKAPTAGKIQFGAGWWFNDQRDGMEAQMKSLANLGTLSKFVGMLTDSRSFVSYPRHEYFRLPQVFQQQRVYRC